MVRAQEKWIRQGGTRGTIIENGLFRIRQYRLRGHFFFNGNDKGSGLYLKLGNFCRPLFMQFLKYILVLSRGEGPRPSFFAGTGA